MKYRFLKPERTKQKQQPEDVVSEFGPAYWAPGATADPPKKKTDFYKTQKQYNG